MAANARDNRNDFRMVESSPAGCQWNVCHLIWTWCLFSSLLGMNTALSLMLAHAKQIDKLSIRLWIEWMAGMFDVQLNRRPTFCPELSIRICIYLHFDGSVWRARKLVFEIENITLILRIYCVPSWQNEKTFSVSFLFRCFFLRFVRVLVARHRHSSGSVWY